MTEPEKNERSEMKSVTELLDAVPQRVWEGIRFVATEDIPEPYRSTFEAWMVGQGCPLIEGYELTVYAWDWERWRKLFPCG